MPAYVQHHEIDKTVAVVCPSCTERVPMYVRNVEPHWSMSKIDFIYECTDCGAEVRQTVTRPERRH
jgi:DNA-directed RNA polymerase subunit RPC12/RpoP